MKYIVTGGAGFIGSNLTKQLVADGHTVTVIDNLSTGNKKNIESLITQIKFVEGSILDLPLLQDLFQEQDVVFHEAALPSVGRSLADPKTTTEVNINGTLNVLIAARDCGIKKVVFASSSSVYGDTKVLPKVETMTPQPKSPYALTKYTDELYCQMFSKYFGLPTACLRYFNVFGPHQSPKSEYAAVIPRFITAALKNESPTIYGDGEQTRDFTFVKDVVKANILAAASGVNDGSVMNIACNKNTSLNELLNRINALLKTNVSPRYEEGRVGDVRDSLADITKAHELIGYTPSFTLDDGLAETIDWMKTQ